MMAARPVRRPVSRGSGRYAAADPAMARLDWPELTRRIEACDRCPLHRTRRHAVVYRGARHPRVLFVGEAPGAEEDAQGLPFVGRAGRRLDRAIAEAGLGPTEFGVTNLLKCRPPDNRFDRRSAATCRPYLDRQVELLAPERLVTLGAHALRALDPTAPPITRSAGHPRQVGGRPMLPLLHPAAALHAPRLAAQWHEGVATLRAWLAQPTSINL
jgi:uracil-DNA glycosylase family 4